MCATVVVAAVGVLPAVALLQLINGRNNSSWY
jgi:hypothetical protein